VSSLRRLQYQREGDTPPRTTSRPIPTARRTLPVASNVSEAVVRLPSLAPPARRHRNAGKVPRSRAPEDDLITPMSATAPTATHLSISRQPVLRESARPVARLTTAKAGAIRQSPAITMGAERATGVPSTRRRR